MPTNTKTTKISVRKKWGWIIAGSIVILLLCLIYININLVRIGYYYVFKADHFNVGEKVYSSQLAYDIPNTTALGAQRLIRPLTQRDINVMDVSILKKDELRKNIDTTLKPFVKSFTIYFLKKDFVKYKSAFIGTFLETRILPTQDANGQMYLGMFYTIKPNRKVFHEEDAEYRYDIKLPQSYTLADSDIYVNPDMVSSKELSKYVNQ